MPHCTLEEPIVTRTTTTALRVSSLPDSRSGSLLPGHHQQPVNGNVSKCLFLLLASSLIHSLPPSLSEALLVDLEPNVLLQREVREHKVALLARPLEAEALVPRLDV